MLTKITNIGISLIVIAGIVYCCITNFNPVIMGILLCAVLSLIAIFFPVLLKDETNVVQLECPKFFDINTLYETIKNDFIGDLAYPRLGKIHGYSNKAIILESKENKEFIYVIYEKPNVKIYVSNNKGLLSNFFAAFKTPASEYSAQILTVQNKVYCAVTNFLAGKPIDYDRASIVNIDYTIESGVLINENSEKDSFIDLSQQQIEIYKKKQKILGTRLFLGGLALLILFILLVTFVDSSFMGETYEGLYCAILIFAVVPMSIYLMVKGIIVWFKNKMPVK